MGADHTFYVKTIETQVRAFLPLNISTIGTVQGVSYSMIYFIISGKVERISLSIHGGISNMNCGGYNVRIEILPQCTREDPSTDPWCKRPWSYHG